MLLNGSPRVLSSLLNSSSSSFAFRSQKASSFHDAMRSHSHKTRSLIFVRPDDGDAAKLHAKMSCKLCGWTFSWHHQTLTHRHPMNSFPPLPDSKSIVILKLPPVVCRCWALPPSPPRLSTSFVVWCLFLNSRLFSSCFMLWWCKDWKIILT